MLVVLAEPRQLVRRAHCGARAAGVLHSAAAEASCVMAVLPSSRIEPTRTTPVGSARYGSVYSRILLTPTEVSVSTPKLK